MTQCRDRTLSERRRQKGQSKRRDVMTDTEVGVMQDHKPRSAGSFWELGRARKWILPQSFQEKHNLSDPFLTSGF